MEKIAANKGKKQPKSRKTRNKPMSDAKKNKAYIDVRIPEVSKQVSDAKGKSASKPKSAPISKSVEVPTPKAKPKVEPKAKPKVEPKAKPKAKPKVAPKSGSAVAKIKAVPKPKIFTPKRLGLVAAGLAGGSYLVHKVKQRLKEDAQ